MWCLKGLVCDSVFVSPAWHSGGGPSQKGDGKLEEHPGNGAAREQAEDVRVLLHGGGAGGGQPRVLARVREAGGRMLPGL